MAVLALPEFDSHPSSPAEHYRYYNRTDDKVYEQVLPVSVELNSYAVATGDAVRSSHVTTLTISAGHGFVAGQWITVSGMTDTSFNGDFIVDSVTSTTVSYLQNLADATSGDGSVAPKYPYWVEVTEGREIRDDVRVNDSLARTKYPGRDFQTFLDESLSWIKENYGDHFNDFMQTDFGVMFVTYVSYMLDELAWYMDKEATEFFWSLLRLRSRAEEMARYLAYKPSGATAASADVTVTLTDGPYSTDITLPEGFQFSTDSGIIFELDSDLTFSAGETEKTLVSVVQGVTHEEQFVSTGDAHQQFELTGIPDGEYLAEDSVRVWVDGSEWTEYDFLPFGRINGFEVSYGTNPPVVRMGDGVVGNIPTANALVLIRYRSTQAAGGLKATVGTIKNVVNPLVVGGNEVSVSVVSTSGATGGSDMEAIEKIKASAPDYFKTADRGVTKEDLTTLTNKFSDGTYGSIAKGKANIVRGIDGDYALQALLDAVDIDTGGLSSALSGIQTSASNCATAATSIDTARQSIELDVSSAKGNISDASDYLDTAKDGLDSLPYQDVIGVGDASTITFSSTLTHSPVYAGSVVVWLSDHSVEQSGTSGDCDTTPGSLIVSFSAFTAADVGKAIEIAGQVRSIVQYVSGTEVKYSGALISGTGLSWRLYSRAALGQDDGNGNISGTYIAAATVNYTTGNISVTFSNAPDGGVLVWCQYGYQDGGTVSSSIDSAVSKLSAATTDLDAIDTIVGSSGSIATDISTITTETASIGSQVTLALQIPQEIEDDMDSLKSYLDEHLSGDCKANIVVVQALTVDSNGYYAAPSQALLTALKNYLEQHNVVPTTIATVSGYRNVIAVDMDVRIEVAEPYKYASVLPKVQSAIDNLFKGRDYGEDLLRGTYYGVVLPDPVTGQGGVKGVSRADISITGTSFPDPSNTGTPPSVDSNGNLIIGEDYILTRGTITYSEIV